METTHYMLMHDIRNPINNITSLSQLIRSSQDLPQSLQHLVDLLIEESEKAGEITQLSGLYQQLDAGSYRPEPTWFNVLDLLAKIRRRTNVAFPTNPVVLWIDGNQTDVSQYCMFFSDARATELMLQNLIQNAVEASPPSAPVRVDLTTHLPVERDEHGNSRQAPNPTITIHNQTAIPIEVRDSFFEKFATFGKAKGTGLGTYIAMQIAKSHGGTLTFTTDDERGTTLQAELPNLSLAQQLTLTPQQ